jgi:hypothetical protein
MKKILLLTVCVILAGSHPVFAVNYDVPGDFATIQQAINAASNGDVIDVAHGVYNECIDFLGKSISLIGDPVDPAQVVIRGNGSDATVSFKRDEDAGAMLKGFSLTGGVGWRNYDGQRIGGGIFLTTSASPRLENLRIYGNHAVYGGGIAIYAGNPHPTLTDVEIFNNSVSGGLYGTPYGGGIVIRPGVQNPDQVILTRVSIHHNSALAGGAIQSQERAEYRLVNCTIANNQASTGGGIYAEDHSNVVITSSIFFGNSNSNIRLGRYGGNEVFVDYSLVQNGANGIPVETGELHWGNGNLSSDPCFANVSSSDYSLRWGSPAIDSGNPADEDPDQTRADMGAYYFDQSVAFLSSEDWEDGNWTRNPRWTVEWMPGGLGIVDFGRNGSNHSLQTFEYQGQGYGTLSAPLRSTEDFEISFSISYRPGQNTSIWKAFITEGVWQNDNMGIFIHKSVNPDRLDLYWNGSRLARNTNIAYAPGRWYRVRMTRDQDAHWRIYWRDETGGEESLVLEGDDQFGNLRHPTFALQGQGNYNEGGILVDDISVGRIPSAEIAVQPNPVEFGDVELGVTSERELVINNPGNSPLTIQQIECTGSYSIDLNAPVTIQAGESIARTVRFTPEGSGEDLGSIEFTSNAVNEPRLSVACSGTGVTPEIVIDPLAILFGDVRIGQSASSHFTISNIGSGQLRMAEPSVTVGDFTVDPSGALVLNPGESIDIQVTYTASIYGPVEGDILIESNDIDEPSIAMRISGRGTSPLFSVEPAEISFGDVELLRTAYRHFTVHNGGNAAGHIQSVEVEGIAFRLISGEGGVVDAGESREFEVAFAPESVGSFAGMATLITDQSGLEPIGIDLEGRSIWVTPYVLLDRLCEMVQTYGDTLDDHHGCHLEGDQENDGDERDNRCRRPHHNRDREDDYLLNGRQQDILCGKLHRAQRDLLQHDADRAIRRLERFENRIDWFVAHRELTDQAAAELNGEAEFIIHILATFDVEILFDVLRERCEAIRRNNAPPQRRRFNDLVRLANAAYRAWETGQVLRSVDLIQDFREEVDRLVSLNYLEQADGNALDEMADAITSSMRTHRLAGASGRSLTVATPIPTELTLKPAHPNPFNSRSTISFGIQQEGFVKLALYDLTGREVIRLVERQFSAGWHSIALNGGEMTAGIYLIRLETSQGIATERIALIK